MVTENGGKQDTEKSPAGMSNDELESKMTAEDSESQTEDVKDTEESSASDDSKEDKREKFIPRDRFDEVVSDRNKTRAEMEEMRGQLMELQGTINDLQSKPATKSDVTEVKEQVSDAKDEYIKTLVEGGIEESTARVIATANFKVFDNKLNKILNDLRDKEIKPLNDNFKMRQNAEFESMLNKRIEEFKKVTPDFQERVADMIKIYNSYTPEKKALLDSDPDGLDFLYSKAKKSLPKEEPNTPSNQIKGRTTSRVTDTDAKTLRKKSLEDLEDEMREMDTEKIK